MTGQYRDCRTLAAPKDGTTTPSTRSLPARVIVADSYPLFHDGLGRVIHRHPPQVIVSEAGSFDEVLRLASSVSPESPALLVLDLLFPGLAASRPIKRLCHVYRHSATAIVSMLGDLHLMDEVLAAGADGYLGKSLEAGEIGMVLQTLGNGEPVVCLRDGSSADSRQRALLDTLTPQQQAVLRLIADGLSNKEIDRALSILPFIVRVHASSLLYALEANTRTTAAVLAAKVGFQAGSMRSCSEFPRKHPGIPRREICRDFPRSLFAALRLGVAGQSHPWGARLRTSLTGSGDARSQQRNST